MAFFKSRTMTVNKQYIRGRPLFEIEIPTLLPAFHAPFLHTVLHPFPLRYPGDCVGLVDWSSGSVSLKDAVKVAVGKQTTVFKGSFVYFTPKSS